MNPFQTYNWLANMINKDSTPSMLKYAIDNLLDINRVEKT